MQTLKFDKRSYWILQLLIAFLFVAAITRNLPNAFENEPGAGVFGGLRLHFVDSFNLNFAKGVPALDGSSHLLDNFWKSFVYGQHGLVDFLHWYLLAPFLDFIGMPLSAESFLKGQAVILITALLLASWAMAKIFASYSLGIVLFVISALVHSQMARTFHIIPTNLLFQGTLLCFMAYYKRDRGLLYHLGLLPTLLLNAMSGNIILMPLFLLFAFAVSNSQTGTTLKQFIVNHLKSPFRMAIYALPVTFGLLLHFYVFFRLGVSNLGVIGYGTVKMGIRAGGPPSLFSSPLFALLQKESTLFLNEFIDWRLAVLFVLFYGVGVWRNRQNFVLWIFPLCYTLVLLALDPRLSQFPVLLVYSLGVVEILRFFDRSSFPIWRRSLALPLALFFFFCFQAEGIRNAFGARVQTATPTHLKAVGFALRERMSAEDKIAAFVPITWNIMNEYYMGKTFFKSPVFGKQIFCYENFANPGTNIVRDDIQKEFPYYVIDVTWYEKDPAYKKFVDDQAARFSLVKQVQVMDQGKEVYFILTSRPGPSQVLEASEGSKLFDEKYANLSKIYFHRHVGLASIWGNY